MSTYIFGHKNPDTDSITASLTYSYLKNALGHRTKPFRLGELNLESQFVLEYFQVDPPEVIKNVKIQLRDLKYDKIKSITPEESIQYAYNYMTEKQIRTLPIVDEKNHLKGIITMRDIAMSLISGDYYKINTSLSNVIQDLNATIVNVGKKVIRGVMLVVAYHYKTVKKKGVINENSVIIVGDRYDVINYCIKKNVCLIIVTGGVDLPKDIIKKAQKNNVSIVVTPYDSYITAKYINQVNYVKSIMKENVIKFNENEYLEDFKEEIQNNPHSNYPIINHENEYLGMVNRRHILNPGKKDVILVDHNEYRQSAEGLDEANILEIVDHHKLGDISTSLPITFRNLPVGSTNTIIYKMYKEYGVEVPEDIAGLMLAGIISDTLLLKSPTTTSEDVKSINELKKKLNLEIETFAMEMFREGTSLTGQNIEEIFFKDFKQFHLYGNKVGVAQVFTLDIEEIFNKKDEYIAFIKSVYKSKEHYLTLLLVTDILKEGSYLLFQSSNRKLLNVAFDQEVQQGDYIDGLVSRKKQVIPKIMNAINILD